MPELPEVESARAVVERAALGRRIADVDDSDTYECRPHEPGEIRAALLGTELTAAHRRGKSMWCETSGEHVLGLHLGMSGRILVSRPRGGSGHGGDGSGGSADGGVEEGGDTVRSTYEGGRPARDGDGRKPEWYRFTLTFDDGGTLRLLDPRRLGRVRLDPDLDHLGPDAGEVGREEFRERVGRGTMALKARLLDQATIAGVGNLLADEVLWQARLDPQRPAGELSDSELDELRRDLRAGIRHAIRHGGVHTGEVIAHRRAGGHCPRCGAEMTRATIGGRTTWWCPVEQV